MTRAEFNDAFRAAVSEEFAFVPVCENEITHSFSQNFRQRMEKLIRSERRISWHWVNTAGKRAAIIIVALLCVLSAAFSVEAIRVPVVNFIVEIFDCFVHVQTEGETTREITYECIPNYIPDGYTLQEERRDVSYISRTYINENGMLLILEQNITVINDNYLDKEKGEISQIIVDGKPVVLYKGTDHSYIRASWIIDGYNLTLRSFGDLPEDVILGIIRNYK